MKVRLRQSLKLLLHSARFLCPLEKHKFNKHGYMHHAVEMIKLKYQKVYEIFRSFQANNKFTAYTDNLQSQLMPKAYRYFTPMSSWTSDARRTFFSSSASIHTRSRYPYTDVDPLRRWSTTRNWSVCRLARDTRQFDDLRFELTSAIARPFVVGASIV